MTIPTPARYLQGTAYIAYGPPPPSPLATIPLHSEPLPSQECNHRQHDHSVMDPRPQSQFWAIFHPSTIQQPTSASDPPAALLPSSSSSSSYFVLRGSPLPWGASPPDMPEPHGCIPPHLYYDLHIFEHLITTTTATTSSHNNKLNEWHVPFAHRFGDGQDDAGGLTTAYQALEHLEDADDFGEFIRDVWTQSSSSPTPSSSSSSSASPSKVHLYAGTEILVGETGTLPTIHKHFFKSPLENTPCLPEPLSQLQSHLEQFSAAKDANIHSPFSVCVANLQLILPPSSSCSPHLK